MATKVNNIQREIKIVYSETMAIWTNIKCVKISKNKVKKLYKKAAFINGILLRCNDIGVIKALIVGVGVCFTGVISVVGNTRD